MAKEIKDIKKSDISEEPVSDTIKEEDIVSDEMLLGFILRY